MHVHGSTSPWQGTSCATLVDLKVAALVRLQLHHQHDGGGGDDINDALGVCFKSVRTTLRTPDSMVQNAQAHTQLDAHEKKKMMRPKNEDEEA